MISLEKRPWLPRAYEVRVQIKDTALVVDAIAI